MTLSVTLTWPCIHSILKNAGQLLSLLDQTMIWSVWLMDPCPTLVTTSFYSMSLWTLDLKGTW